MPFGYKTLQQLVGIIKIKIFKWKWIRNERGKKNDSKPNHLQTFPVNWIEKEDPSARRSRSIISGLLDVVDPRADKTKPLISRFAFAQ
jgi:hypothetical protein